MEKLPTTAKGKILFILICLFCVVMPFSSAVANVVINEIMYHPVSDIDQDDFLELYNTGKRYGKSRKLANQWS